MSTKSLVTPQRWKLWLLCCPLAVFALLMLAPTKVAALFGVEAAAVTLAGVALGIVTLAIASLTLRCPSCGLKLVWHALSKQSASSWLAWLLAVEACPQCGHSPSEDFPTKQ